MRRKEYYHEINQRHYYFMNIGNGEIIDACRKVCVHSIPTAFQAILCTACASPGSCSPARPLPQQHPSEEGPTQLSCM